MVVVVVAGMKLQGGGIGGDRSSPIIVGLMDVFSFDSKKKRKQTNKIDN